MLTKNGLASVETANPIVFAAIPLNANTANNKTTNNDLFISQTSFKFLLFYGVILRV
jgi:hypothetical protein